MHPGNNWYTKVVQRDVPGGGFIDSGQGQRYYLGGETFFGPFLIGNNTLTPR